MHKSSIELAHGRIVRFLTACDRRVWTETQLDIALEEMREEWKLAARIDKTIFIEYLVKANMINYVRLDFPHRPYQRYWLGKPKPYELACSIDPQGYLSHHTAIYLNGLCREEPETIYLNTEQPGRGARGPAPQQSAIDRAFQIPPRISNNRANYEQWTVCRIHGKNTGELGVNTRGHQTKEVLRLTNIARTLIDIVVRPEYSGGVEAVAKAFQNAMGKFRISELVRIVSEIGHVYPYHQAIGFYIERTGKADPSELQELADLGITRSFYLDRQILQPKYSDKWAIFYPGYLDGGLDRERYPSRR